MSKNWQLVLSFYCLLFDAKNLVLIFQIQQVFFSILSLKSFDSSWICVGSLMLEVSKEIVKQPVGPSQEGCEISGRLHVNRVRISKV